MRVVALLAWLALLAATAWASPLSLLLVVGDVSASTARVLVGGRATGSIATASVFLRTTPSSSSHAVHTLEREVPLDFSTALDGGAPRVLTLDALSPGREYVVAFQGDAIAHDDATVRFRTPGAPQDASPPTRVLVVSCDRFVDDGDDALWRALERDLDAHTSEYFGVAHIGDQVYVDAGAARVPIAPVRDATAHDRAALRAQYDATVAQFRRVYYATLGRAAAQRVLRRGAHWMLPDDHEVINNLNSYSMDRVFGATDTTDEAQRRGLQLHYRAGLQVMYEFQYQLRGDVAWGEVDFLEDPLETILTRYPLYFGVEIDRLKLFFLDVRFDRSLTLHTPEERRKLVSSTQRDELKHALSRWSNDPEHVDSSIVVLAAMPLFFHSRLTANIVYAVEKELYPGHPEHHHGLEELFVLFQEFLQSPKPALQLLVGGDVHTLAHTRVCGSSHDVRSKCIDQLVTSGLTNGSTAINDVKLVPFYLLILRLYPLYDWLASTIGLAPAPWVLSADRVFLGRNYGVLEIDSRGAFEWRNSVVIDHDALGAIVTQAIFDVLHPPITILLGFAVVVAILSVCSRSHKPTAVPKDRKTK